MKEGASLILWYLFSLSISSSFPSPQYTFWMIGPSMDVRGLARIDKTKLKLMILSWRSTIQVKSHAFHLLSLSISPIYFWLIGPSKDHWGLVRIDKTKLKLMIIAWRSRIQVESQAFFCFPSPQYTFGLIGPSLARIDKTKLKLMILAWRSMIQVESGAFFAFHLLSLSISPIYFWINWIQPGKDHWGLVRIDKTKLKLMILAWRSTIQVESQAFFCFPSPFHLLSISPIYFWIDGTWQRFFWQAGFNLRPPTYPVSYMPNLLHTQSPTYPVSYIPSLLHTQSPTYQASYIPSLLHTQSPT